MTTYAEACHDPNLFGPWFEGETWSTWRVLDKALFGLPLDADELATFKELTGRDEAPDAPATEAWFICGRRSGKDVKAASIAVYLATIGAELYGYIERLTRGERGVVQVLAVDRDQARVCLDYVKAFFEQPMFKRMVTRDTADGIELSNRLAIEITTSDKRRARGRTVVAAVLDECAFLAAENSVNPDEELYRAIKPAMVTIPGAMMIGISSPYARKGLLWRKYKTHFGKPSRTLVVQAPTWRMNPTVARDGEFLTEAFADDSVSAAAEFGAQFRTDIEGFVSREVVEACVSPSVFERGVVPDMGYYGFVDPSGGSADSFTLAIAHLEGTVALLDAIREVKPPFSPESVTADFAALLKAYSLQKVTGDRYGGEFPRELFRRHGVEYEVAERNRSELYRDLLPALSSGEVDLLDSDRLVAQLVSLERRTGRGKDVIDHAPNSHDDLANAVAGALVGVRKKRGYIYDLEAAL